MSDVNRRQAKVAPAAIGELALSFSDRDAPTPSLLIRGGLKVAERDAVVVMDEITRGVDVEAVFDI